MRLGQGSRSRSPWWVWCIALVSGMAVLPGARYVTAQSPEPKQSIESDNAPEYKPNPAPLPVPDEFKANPEGLIEMQIRILEVKSGTDESKKLLARITEQTIDQKERSVSVVEQRFLRTAVFSEEEYSHFAEKILEPAMPTVLTRPRMMTVSGNTANVKVGQFDPQNREVLTNGISLSIKPTQIDSDKIRLDYDMSITRGAVTEGGEQQLGKDQSASDLPNATRKSTVQTTVEFRLDQTFIVASRQSYDDAPYEIVVVKCSMPYANQKPAESRK